MDRQSGKKGEVSAILRNPADGSVCLPGSSLKGALSTPLINWRDQEQSGSKQGDCLKGASNPYEYRKLMEQMFGDIRSHAMQALKVADLVAPPDICTIVKAEDYEIGRASCRERV